MAVLHTVPCLLASKWFGVKSCFVLAHRQMIRLKCACLSVRFSAVCVCVCVSVCVCVYIILCESLLMDCITNVGCESMMFDCITTVGWLLRECTEQCHWPSVL